jgi:large-conductance mechanosensitive channel
MAKDKPKPVKAAAAEKAEHKEMGRIPYLETNIDKFYKFVKEKKRINFYDAATEQGATREQIISWAKILEDHKLAKVHYPVFGAPVILIETEKPKKSFEEEKEVGERKHRKGPPKLMIALAGGLMVLLGYVMFVSNPFTITLRSQITAAVQSFGLGFRFLPYPLNIITPIIIIIAALFAVLRLRKMRKKPKDKTQKEEKEKPKKEEKKSKDGIEDKLSKIKEELGS